MRILVTGGAGYIGSHAARELARRGYEVLLYDNLSTGHRFLAEGFDFIEADIGDRQTVSRSLRGVDAVMHFAAHSNVGESMVSPQKYFHNNVQSGLALLDAVLEVGIRRFIFSSSCAVYGIPPTIPITEQMPRQPVNPYGASKLFVEHALEAYSRSYGLGFVSLRYFNAAGADESGEIGEWHQPETHLIPRALWMAAGRRPELEVYGSDYPTPDGTCIRDYVHVSDLAEAHVLALQYLNKGGQSIALNLGSGTGHSILEVISCVQQVTGNTISARIRPRRSGDLPVLVADSQQAKQVLDWQPARPLPQIISSAWKWMQSLQRRVPQLDLEHSIAECAKQRDVADPKAEEVE